jgi:hypothetical protein
MSGETYSKLSLTSVYIGARSSAVVCWPEPVVIRWVDGGTSTADKATVAACTKGRNMCGAMATASRQGRSGSRARLLFSRPCGASRQTVCARC